MVGSVLIMLSQVNMAETWSGVEADSGGMSDCEDEATDEDGSETPMETESMEESDMKHSSSLQLMLASIAQERSKDCSHKLVSSDGTSNSRNIFLS